METCIAKCCETCLYMATYETACDDCLWTKDDYKLSGNDRPPMRYLNHKFGNWLARVEWFELTGRKNIVIGGQGEAEVNTKWTPEKTSKHLHYVAEQCGYMCERLNPSVGGKYKTLKIYTGDGYYSLNWENDKLKAIFQLESDGTVSGTCWNADNITKRLEQWRKSDDPTTANFEAA